MTLLMQIKGENPHCTAALTQFPSGNTFKPQLPK